MPEICRFYGTVVAMYHSEHARYGGDKAALEIGSLKVLEGRLPPRGWPGG
jgi:hypothetical protein